MIFIGIKKKINQLFLNKKLLVFKQNKKLNSKTKIKRVLFFTDTKENAAWLKQDLSKKLNISEKVIQYLVYTTKNIKEDTENSSFNEADFTIFGKVKSINLKDKLTNHFDLLINYCKVDNVCVNQLLLQCKSDFNVGFPHQNEEIYDFIINCDLKKTDIINSEIKKYLTILNKI